jgi:hypothetical protein
MSNDSTPPFKATSEGKVISTVGATITMIAAVVVGTWAVGRYASNMERALEELQAEVKSMRAEMVMRAPFYAWTGQLRYEMRRVDGTVPEPRVFLEPRNYQP